MGASFPLWGLLLARVQNIFYFNDTQALRDASVVVAIRFVLLGINSLIGYTLQYYCIAQVGQRISTGTTDITPPIYLPVFLSLCLSICLPACLPTCLPACQPISYLPAYLPACLSACRPACLSACLPMCLPISDLPACALACR